MALASRTMRSSVAQRQSGLRVPARVRNVRAQAIGSLPAEGTVITQMPYWDSIQDYLMRKRVRQLQPEEAEALVASGEWVLLDVRPKPNYEKAHPAGAKSAPLYQPLDTSAMDFAKMLKVVAYTFNGVSPIEPNPLFAQQVKEASAGGKGVITVCEAGGTLIPTPNFPTGKPSRSLQAAFKIIFEGHLPAERVAQLDGGAFGWYKEGMDFEGEYDTNDVGRTPNAAPAPPEYVQSNKN